MLQEDLKARLRKLAFPIFIETLLVMMLGAVDTFMLSRYSDNSVAAVGMVNQLVNLAFLVFQVIAIGTSVLCSQYIGAKESKKVVQAVGISLILNTAIGLAVSWCLYSYSREILVLMGLRPELLPEGIGFMRIVGAFAFFQAISMTLSASLRSANKVYYPMMVTLVVNIFNIIGNYALIFGELGMPRLGVEGAAISNSVCRGISAVLLFYFLFKKHIPRFPVAYFKPFPWIELRNLLKIGLPAAGEQVSYSLSQVVVIYFINFISTEALTARTYCVNLVIFTYLLTIALGHAGAIVIGQLVGRDKAQAAFIVGKYGIKFSVLLSTSFSIVLACLGHIIFPLLTSNPDIIKMGIIILWIDVALEIGRALNIFLVNALHAAGDIYFPATVGVVVMWLVSVGFSYLFGIYFGFGLIGMWIAFVLDENIRGVIFIRRWFSLKWMSKGFL